MLPTRVGSDEEQIHAQNHAFFPSCMSGFWNIIYTVAKGCDMKKKDTATSQEMSETAKNAQKAIRNAQAQWKPPSKDMMAEYKKSETAKIKRAWKNIDPDKHSL